jgi:hypothetical protein
MAWLHGALESTRERLAKRRSLQSSHAPGESPTVSVRVVTDVTMIFVDLKGSTPPAEVADVWCRVPKCVGDSRDLLSGRVVGAGFDGDFGDAFASVCAFTADRLVHEFATAGHDEWSADWRRRGRAHRGDCEQNRADGYRGLRCADDFAR